MRPLTETCPKPLLQVGGKPLVEHLLDVIPPEISELIVVVGYLEDQIKSFLGNHWRGRPVNYVLQPIKRGTADALFLCKPFLKKEEQFLVLYADDLHGSATVADCVALGKSCLSVVRVDNPHKFGVVVIDKNRKINPRPKYKGQSIWESQSISFCRLKKAIKSDINLLKRGLE